jgi:hypothetical protein
LKKNSSLSLLTFIRSFVMIIDFKKEEDKKTKKDKSRKKV